MTHGTTSPSRRDRSEAEARAALSRLGIGATTADIFHALRRAVPLAAGFVDAFGPSTDPTGCPSAFALPDDFLEAMMVARPEDAPVVLGLVEAASPGSVLIDRSVLTTERWQDVAGHAALTDAGLGSAACVKLRSPEPGSPVHQYAALFGAIGDRPLTAVEISRLEALAPHVLAAIERARLPLLPHTSIFHQIVATDEVGFVCVDPVTGFVLEANAVAHALAKEFTEALKLEAGGPRLAALVRRVLGARTLAGGLVPHARKRTALRVRLHLLRKEAHALGSDVVVLLLEQLDLSALVPPPAVLVEEHPELKGLPRRLRQVANELVNTDLSVKELAAKLKIAEGTARRHIERLHRELGVRTRAELTHRLRRPIV